MKHSVSLLDTLIIDLWNDGSEWFINTITCEVKKSQCLEAKNSNPKRYVEFDNTLSEIYKKKKYQKSFKKTTYNMLLYILVGRRKKVCSKGARPEKRYTDQIETSQNFSRQCRSTPWNCTVLRKPLQPCLLYCLRCLCWSRAESETKRGT